MFCQSIERLSGDTSEAIAIGEEIDETAIG